MGSFKAKFRLASIAFLSIVIVLVAIYDLLKPISNGCTMTYMYANYIPISAPKNLSFSKYGLYLYREGWERIDFNEHLKKLSGVPVLFIPGNGGSYKQVRSLAAESDRAYQRGPLEPMLYQEASLGFEEAASIDATYSSMVNKYTRRLDWFAVDLEGEHSAMDRQILEEHTEYVVYAIHRILDHYKESCVARSRKGAVYSCNLPNSVILVGHSMGGFVARAAVIHPNLRNSAVETILTLSTPHQAPPVPLQPSLGHYYEYINQQWRKGYEVETSRMGNHLPWHQLSQVIVISISGGTNDYQVRSKLESVDGIVPSTHGFMISSMGMRNVWLSMEHQVICWCNELVVQVSHTLLSLVDSRTGHPFSDTRKRLALFTKMLHSGMPESLWRQSHLLQGSPHLPLQEGEHAGLRMQSVSACPSKLKWSDERLQKDLYIETSTVTILAMDGRRRWLDVTKLGSNGRNHFVLVTNLLPCYGIRLHLWHEKGTSTPDLHFSKRVVEVTSKIAQLSSGAAGRRIKPGSQTVSPSTSAVLWLDPEDMQGFRFLTISVAPSPAVSGRPPPAAWMAVGQFFDPEEGRGEFSHLPLLLSMFSGKDIFLKEDHSLAMNIKFGINLGLLPATVTVEATSCMDDSRLCMLSGFPPVALVLDATSGLHVFSNLSSPMIIVDSSPALWSSVQGSEQTNILLLVDPHCSYKVGAAVSFTAAASRFMLLYCFQIIGFSFAVTFFGLMRQTNAWELNRPIPSLLSAVESNLRMPLPFFSLAVSPILFALLYSCLNTKPSPSVISFLIVSIICYLIANGVITILIITTQISFYLAIRIHVFFKTRWTSCLLDLSTSFFSFKVTRGINVNPSLATSLVAIGLVYFVHPALGLLILQLSHVSCCHYALFSFLTASRKDQTKALFGLVSGSTQDSETSYGDTQLHIFHRQHGLLILHLLSLFMFVPSLVAWFETLNTGHKLPSFSDSVLCMFIIFHGTLESKSESNLVSNIPGIKGYKIKQGLVYLIAGYCCYLSGLDLAPYKAFYAMATVGVVSCVFRIVERGNRKMGGINSRNRKHSHQH